MADPMDKTLEEILVELSTYSAEGFLACFRNETLGGAIAAREGAKLIEDLLNDEEINKEEIRELAQIIQRSADYVMNMLNALAQYERNQRRNQSHDTNS